jgi:hypothetical protein
LGTAKTPAPVCLILALTCRTATEGDQALALFQEQAGAIALASSVFTFSHTRYYEAEMGSELIKAFYAFERLIDPTALISLKLFSNQIERQFSTHDQRRVNLDPGYLEAAKLILATTKNFSHRIYLGEGIYGDVQLFWRNGRFQVNPWTYPDYQDELARDFFTRARERYLKNRGDVPWPLPTNNLA